MRKFQLVVGVTAILACLVAGSNGSSSTNSHRVLLEDSRNATMMNTTTTETAETVMPSTEEGASESHLEPLDGLRESASNVSRSGIVDVLTFDESEEEDDSENESSSSIGICHLSLFLPISVLTPKGPILFGLSGVGLSAIAAAELAIDMLNKGDGSVIKELEGLNQRCPIKFTSESVDPMLNPKRAVQKTIELLQRTTAEAGTEIPKQEGPEICAFLGPSLSSEAIAMALITGIAERPQLR